MLEFNIYLLLLLIDERSIHWLNHQIPHNLYLENICIIEHILVFQFFPWRNAREKGSRKEHFMFFNEKRRKLILLSYCCHYSVLIQIMTLKCVELRVVRKKEKMERKKLWNSPSKTSGLGIIHITTTINEFNVSFWTVGHLFSFELFDIPKLHSNNSRYECQISRTAYTDNKGGMWFQIML